MTSPIGIGGMSDEEGNPEPTNLYEARVAREADAEEPSAESAEKSAEGATDEAKDAASPPRASGYRKAVADEESGKTPERPKPSHVRVTWVGDESFDAGRPGGPTGRLDGHGKTGQSPPEWLLSALAACTSVDIVAILAKRRTPASRQSVDVIGERVATVPRRYESILLQYQIDGEGIERVHAERAIELSITKYCSVRDSLAFDIPVAYELTLNGEAGDRRETPAPDRAGGGNISPA